MRLEGMRWMRWRAPGHRARGSGARPLSTCYVRCWATGWATQAAGDAGRGAVAGDAATQAAGRQRRGNGSSWLGAREWPGGPGSARWNAVAPARGMGRSWAAREWAGHTARWADGGQRRGARPFLCSSFDYFLLFLFVFIHKKELQIKWVHT
jgi:hypothetical protein